MPTVSVFKLSKGNENTNEKVFEGNIELGKPIFDELDSQGFKLPAGCLAGSCGSCAILILEGAELLKKAGTIESDTVSSLIESQKVTPPSKQEPWQYRLSCRAKVEQDGHLVLGIIHREA
jgi:ferredoxin